MKRNEILWNCDRHSVEPVTMRKYVAEYEQMWKWIVEFLSKFQGRGIKIIIVNSIRVGISMIFFNILHAIAPWVTSSWAIVFFALSLRLLPLVYILWLMYVIKLQIICRSAPWLAGAPASAGHGSSVRPTSSIWQRQITLCYSSSLSTCREIQVGWW